MTTQQQSGDPQELSQRVPRLEGAFEQFSLRLDTMERSIEGLRADLTGFKNTMYILVFGSWVTLLAAIFGSRFID